ncbi:MAG: hypothetical protein KBD48_00635 [Candidatus Pacebacteria bacterium]|nr:hypothetical protein [Candidatus Paceibacterota bacterium]MBP9715686.1 hypothetical protein [Candidatus Paceibacterota bacterium]
MAQFILSSENIGKVVEMINTITAGKQYWVGVDFKMLNQVEESTRWFNGSRNFNRLAELKASIAKNLTKLIISHYSVIRTKPFSPDELPIAYGSNILIEKNDIIIFKKDDFFTEGMCVLYMERTEARFNKYKQ